MFGEKEPVKNVCSLFCLLNTTIYPQAGLKLLKAMQKMSGDKNLAAFHTNWNVVQSENCTVGSRKHSSVLLHPI